MPSPSNLDGGEEVRRIGPEDDEHECWEDIVGTRRLAAHLQQLHQRRAALHMHERQPRSQHWQASFGRPLPSRFATHATAPTALVAENDSPLHRDLNNAVKLIRGRLVGINAHEGGLCCNPRHLRAQVRGDLPRGKDKDKFQQ